MDIYRTTRLCQARTILCTGLLDTKYDAAREDEAISILEEHPELALAKWTGPDDNGQPFILGSTALHYAANDGKLRLMQSLIDLGADVNAHEAGRYAIPLSWAANNAHLAAINLLLDNGASVHSANALHAAAFVGENFELRGKKIPTCCARFELRENGRRMWD